MSDGFSSLAENEKLPAGNPAKTLQALDEEQADDAALAAEEEHVLRCLGAAVIMQWNTIPTKLQREFFDTAGSMGELLATAELKRTDRPVSAQAQRSRHGEKERRRALSLYTLRIASVAKIKETLIMTPSDGTAGFAIKVGYFVSAAVLVVFVSMLILTTLHP